MKVTALIPDQIMAEVKLHTNAKNTTDSLIKALTDWLSRKKIERLNSEISRNPLTFGQGYSAKRIRSLNRSI